MSYLALPGGVVHNFAFKVKYGQNPTEIPSLSTTNCGIWEIFAILCHLNLVSCIDNAPAIDCHLLVHNLTLKAKCQQNRTEIPSLLVINFGICEIFAILN